MLRYLWLLTLISPIYPLLAWWDPFTGGVVAVAVWIAFALAVLVGTFRALA